jgi:hypothetical protein
VSVALAVPPELSVTVDGVMNTAGPGRVLNDSVMVPENPLRLVKPILLFTFTTKWGLNGAVTREGCAVTTKSGGRYGADTYSQKLVVCDKVPLVPVIVTV